MPVTQDYKIVTLSGKQVFAVVRALQSRVSSMQQLADESLNEGGKSEVGLYAHHQANLTRDLLRMIEATPFNSVTVGEG